MKAAEGATEARQHDEDLASVARRAGTSVAAAIFVFTLVSVGVGLLVTEGFGGAVVRFDRGVSEDLVAARTSRVTAATAVTTVLADSVTVAVLWVAATAIARRWTRSWTTPAFLLAAIGGEKLTYLLTSLIVGRPRPTVPALGSVHAANGFPSGHVGSVFVLYGGAVIAILWHRWSVRGCRPSVASRVALAALVLVVALAVAFSRVYRGHHFFSDVVWGAVLGVAWLALAWRLVLRDAPRPTGPQ